MEVYCLDNENSTKLDIRKNMNSKTVYRIGILGAVLFATSSILGGLLIKGYDPLRQLISETYAIEVTYGLYLRMFGVIPSGILFTLFFFYAKKHFPQHQIIQNGFNGLVLFYGLSTIIVGIFLCDHGCNPEFTNPSTAQIIHNLFGFLTYLTVPCFILLLSVGLRKTNHTNLSYLGIILGLLSTILVLFIFLNPKTFYFRVYQRIIECSFLLWVISCANTLKGVTHED